MCDLATNLPVDTGAAITRDPLMLPLLAPSASACCSCWPAWPECRPEGETTEKEEADEDAGGGEV